MHGRVLSCDNPGFVFLSLFLLLGGVATITRVVLGNICALDFEFWKAGKHFSVGKGRRGTVTKSAAAFKGTQRYAQGQGAPSLTQDLLNPGAADSPPGMMQGEESAKLPGLKSVVLTPIVYEKLGNIFAFFESQFSNRKKKKKGNDTLLS